MSKRFHHHPLSRRRHERLQEIVWTPTSATGGSGDGNGGGSSPSTPRTPSASSSTRSTNRRPFTFSSDSDRLDMQTRDASARVHRSSRGSDRDSGKDDPDSDEEEAKADATDAAGDPNAQVVYCCRGERKWVSYMLSVVNRCKAEGRIAWLFHQEEFCSYKDVLELVRRDVVDGFPLWCDTRDTAFAIPLLSAGLAQLLWPCHLLWSPHGRGIWWRVLKNYVYLGMVSLGIWTDASVEDFRVFARYDDFKRSLAFMSKQQTLPSSSSSESQRMRYMANPLASSMARASGGDTSPTPAATATAASAGAAASSPVVTSSSSSSPLAELFAAYGIPFLDDASEDPQELLQYVASNIASRVVLLQLVPYLTAVSVVMADIATCPMFLFSSKLRSRLPPYILWTPFAEARRLLRQSMQWRTVDAQRRRRRSTGVVDLEAGSRSAAGAATATTHTVEKDPPVWMVWFLGQKLF
eukprot:gene19035-13736_t